MTAVLRLDLIGASDVPTLAGVSTYSTPGDLWARIVHGVRTEAGEAADWGTRLEAVVADHYGERHGVRPEVVPSVVHPKGRSWQRVSLDRRLGSREALEVKTVSRERARDLGPSGSEEVLDAHYLQVQAQAEALDLDVVHVAYLIGGQEYREYHVPADRELGGQLVDLCASWWAAYVETREAPPLTAPELRWLAVRREAESATSDEVALIEAYEAARAATVGAEAAQKAARARLCDAIGDRRGLTWSGGRVTWAEIRPRLETDWEAVARALAAMSPLDSGQLAELLRCHTGTRAGYRRLDVRRAKGGAS